MLEDDQELQDAVFGNPPLFYENIISNTDP